MLWAGYLRVGDFDVDKCARADRGKSADYEGGPVADAGPVVRVDDHDGNAPLAVVLLIADSLIRCDHEVEAAGLCSRE